MKDIPVTPTEHLNFIDKAIGYFSPEAGIHRMKARVALHEFDYNPVTSRRGSSGGIWGNAGSETWRSQRDRLKSMWDARDLAMYDWVGGMLSRVVLYVCGRCHCKSTTGDEYTDSAYDEYLHNWCGDEVDEGMGTICDLTGRHRFIKMVQQSFLGFLVDGDHGFIEIAPQESITGRYCLQAIEADRIGSPIEGIVEESYIGGVGLDPQSGRINFYRIFQRTRTNQYVNPREITPDNFIHVIDPDRADEYRGRTKLLRLLNDARDIREWVEAEKMAGKTQSQFAVAVATRDPYAPSGPGAWEMDRKIQGPNFQRAEWGKILKMGESESFSMLTPASRPSGAFLAFVQMIIRKMAVSLDLPYGFLWDLATLGGVTARIEVQQALRRIQYWQDNVIRDRILNRVRTKVISEGIANQVLPPHPNFKKCEWHFGPWISTDVGYESQADIQGAMSGLIPITEIAAKYGRSPREVFVSNAGTANEAINVGAEQQMPVEVFAGGLYPTITIQKAAMNTPPQPPPPPPPAGSIDALGDKGVKALLDLLKAVGTGEIDRESGIETLITTFRLSREDAEEICPDEPDPVDVNRLEPQNNGNGSKQIHKVGKRP